MDEKNMTDEELAKHYAQRRGDVSGWLHVERPRKSRRGRSTSVFSVRLTQEELRSVQTAAEQSGQYISAFIRDAALEAAKGTRLMIPLVSGSVVSKELDDAIRSALQSVA